MKGNNLNDKNTTLKQNRKLLKLKEEPTMKDTDLNDKKYTTESKLEKRSNKKRTQKMKGNNLNYIKFNTEIKQKNNWNYRFK